MGNVVSMKDWSHRPMFTEHSPILHLASGPNPYKTKVTDVEEGCAVRETPPGSAFRDRGTWIRKAAGEKSGAGL
jgi:hypothetical protein